MSHVVFHLVQFFAAVDSHMGETYNNKYTDISRSDFVPLCSACISLFLQFDDL